MFRPAMLRSVSGRRCRVGEDVEGVEVAVAGHSCIGGGSVLAEAVGDADEVGSVDGGGLDVELSEEVVDVVGIVVVVGGGVSLTGATSGSKAGVLCRRVVVLSGPDEEVDGDGV